jgi:hypothetical protein
MESLVFCSELLSLFHQAGHIFSNDVEFEVDLRSGFERME